MTDRNRHDQQRDKPRPEPSHAGEGDAAEGDIAEQANRNDSAEPRPIPPERRRGPRP